jgi:hypothetical protein
MQVISLDFGPSSRIPSGSGLGIAIAVSGVPQKPSMILVEGRCRMPKKSVPFGGQALLGGIFLTAVHAQNHQPVLVNVAGDVILSPDDVQDLGTDFGACFECVLDLAAGPIGPFFLHASCFEHVSNVVYVAGAP